MSDREAFHREMQKRFPECLLKKNGDGSYKSETIREFESVWQAALQRSGEPVVFTCHGNNAPAYGCNKPGDMSGTYYKAPQPVVPEGSDAYLADVQAAIKTGDLVKADMLIQGFRVALLSAGAVATPQPVVRYTHAETQQLIEIMCPEESHHLHRCRSELLSAGKETDRG